MTRHEKLLADALRREIDGLAGDALVERLFARGLINLSACEQRAVHTLVDELGRQGLRRCEAMCATAELFCCSYEKVRNHYYNSCKS